MSDVDDKLDAAWHATSREEPPAALDDAIRAAARRAVGAGPSRTRHMRSWPLAAAAVVAVLAIGIVHLTPPEHVTPTIVADSSARRDAIKEQDAPPRPVAAPAVDATAPAIPAPPVATAPPPAPHPAPSDRVNSAPRKQVAQPATAPPTNPPVAIAGNAPQRDAAATGETDATRDRIAELKSKLERAESEAPAKKGFAEPFPAAPAMPKTDTAAAAPTAPAPVLAAASKSVPTSGGAAAADGSLAGRNSVAPAAAPMRLAKAAPEREVKDAAPRTPDEWIKLIRRLQSEGRKEDVLKEIAAFRSEYKDRADSLLPADLREIK